MYAFIFFSKNKDAKEMVPDNIKDMSRAGENIEMQTHSVHPPTTDMDKSVAPSSTSSHSRRSSSGRGSSLSAVMDENSPVANLLPTDFKERYEQGKSSRAGSRPTSAKQTQGDKTASRSASAVNS